jgi:AraC-like DNA-binding protein
MPTGIRYVGTQSAVAVGCRSFEALHRTWFMMRRRRPALRHARVRETVRTSIRGRHSSAASHAVVGPTVRDRVYDVVSGLLVRRSDITPARVASVLEMSMRTLQRRLQEEGSSLREIRDRVCRDRAARALLDPAVSISRVARDLGFCDIAAFSKAFKRWTGKSPSDYRPPRQRRYSGRGPP